ncbi:hypothetical protein P5673_012021 [Acropora cervicornis]|uniref:Uncharacterized protein n=1 Tax=Acropora cervicornis TaxID=6130 RepID=A0AAD9QNF3_ACRCE|nr:hypothetical protein P5673_012021 [Acropora cervicornis]
MGIERVLLPLSSQVRVQNVKYLPEHENQHLTLVDSINVKLGKDYNMVGVAGPICDPVFLCHGCLQRSRPMMYDMFKLHRASTHFVRSSLRKGNNRQH